MRADRPDVLLPTPEALRAMLDSWQVDRRALFASVRAVVVVDELDAIAGDDRGRHVLAALGRVEWLAGWGGGSG
jgi:ATP-dependent Lhr-like helicase